MRRLTLFLPMLAAACIGEDRDDAVRYSDPAKTFEVVQPDAWRPQQVRGSVEFRREGVPHKRHTIVVRSSERPLELIEGRKTTRDDVVAATASALSAMPNADVGAPQPVARAELPATRFSLTFEPRSVSGRYHREHAVLTGRTHLFHVIYTAPVGEPIDERAFTNLVSTLTEGV